MLTEQSARASVRESFNAKFQELWSEKKLNCFNYSKEQYLELIDSVKSAKEAKSKTTLQYRRLKRFDLCSVSGVEKLIAPLSSSETTIKYYVCNDELFDILHEIHLAVGHGGKHRMEKECKKKYKNITQEAIKLYLRLCEPCQNKKLNSAKNECSHRTLPSQHWVDLDVNMVKTPAERARERRALKKLMKQKPPAKTPAERQRACRARKKGSKNAAIEENETSSSSCSDLRELQAVNPDFNTLYNYLSQTNDYQTGQAEISDENAAKIIVIQDDEAANPQLSTSRDNDVTSAERSQECTADEKLLKGKPPPKSGAQRNREYRARKKALRNGAATIEANETSSSSFSGSLLNTFNSDDLQLSTSQDNGSLLYHYLSQTGKNSVDNETQLEEELLSSSAVVSESKMASKQATGIPPLKLQGRRIVDVDYFLKQVFTILQHGLSSNCKLTDLVIIEETSLGLSSAFSFNCKKCGFQSILLTNSDHTELNDKAVYGALNSGLNHEQFNQVLTSLDIPTLPIAEFEASKGRISEGMEAQVWNSMKQAAEDEARFAFRESELDNSDRPVIPVVVDSDSMSDRVVIFGQRTRKILNFGVANQFCTVCAWANVAKLKVGQHHCPRMAELSKNEYVFQAFAKSEEMFGVTYKQMWSDGAFNQDLVIRKANGDFEIKISECFESLLRDYKAKLVKLTVKRKDSYVASNLRNELKAKVLSFGEVLVKAVMLRSTCQDEISVKCDLLRKDIRNLPSHVFDEHELCAELSSYCNQMYVKSELVLEMRKCGYFDEIVLCSEKLQENVESLLADLESDAIKAFNLVFDEHFEVEGKKRGAYGIKCMSAVLNYNKKKGSFDESVKNKNVQVLMETDNFEERVVETKIEIEDANFS